MARQHPQTPIGQIVFGTEFEGNSQPVSFHRLTERHMIGACSYILIIGNHLLVIRRYIALTCDIMLTTGANPVPNTIAHWSPGVHCFRGGVLPWCRTRFEGTDIGAVVPSHVLITGDECRKGRREGDILLRVLPKSRGQQYRVRSDVRARLIRGLEAPLKLGLLPDTRPQLPKTTKRPLNFHHSGCREAA